MNNSKIPDISEQEIRDFMDEASRSPRRRHPKILHSPGDEFNRVFNFIMKDSYMQPHLHPGDEKIEKIHLIRGKIAALYFDDHGTVIECTLLEEDGRTLIEVPAFTWHTYIMLSDSAISYETMMGVYEPNTWKTYAAWAPTESSLESASYLDFLKGEVAKRIVRD